MFAPRGSGVSGFAEPCECFAQTPIVLALFWGLSNLQIAGYRPQMPWIESDLESTPGAALSLHSPCVAEHMERHRRHHEKEMAGVEKTLRNARPPSVPQHTLRTPDATVCSFQTTNGWRRSVWLERLSVDDSHSTNESRKPRYCPTQP